MTHIAYDARNFVQFILIPFMGPFFIAARKKLSIINQGIISGIEQVFHVVKHHPVMRVPVSVSCRLLFLARAG